MLNSFTQTEDIGKIYTGLANVERYLLKPHAAGEQQLEVRQSTAGINHARHLLSQLSHCPDTPDCINLVSAGERRSFLQWL